MNNRVLLSDLLTDMPACTHATLLAVVRDAVTRHEIKAVPFGAMPGGQGPELVIQGTEETRRWIKALQDNLKAMLRADWSKKSRGGGVAPFDPAFVTDELLDAMLAASESSAPAAARPSKRPQKAAPAVPATSEPQTTPSDESSAA